MPIRFHDQCPSSASTCTNAVAAHMTIHRDLSSVSLQHVSFIYSLTDELKQ